MLLEFMSLRVISSLIIFSSTDSCVPIESSLSYKECFFQFSANLFSCVYTKTLLLSLSFFLMIQSLKSAQYWSKMQEKKEQYTLVTLAPIKKQSRFSKMINRGKVKLLLPENTYTQVTSQIPTFTNSPQNLTVLLNVLCLQNPTTPYHPTQATCSQQYPSQTISIPHPSNIHNSNGYLYLDMGTSGKWFYVTGISSSKLCWIGGWIKGGLMICYTGMGYYQWGQELMSVYLTRICELFQSSRLDMFMLVIVLLIQSRNIFV